MLIAYILQIMKFIKGTLPSKIMKIIEMRFMGLKVLYTSPAFSVKFPGLNTDPKGGRGGLA